MWKFNKMTVMLHKLCSLTYTETFKVLCFQWLVFNCIIQKANLCTLPEEKTHYPVLPENVSGYHL